MPKYLSLKWRISETEQFSMWETLTIKSPWVTGPSSTHMHTKQLIYSFKPIFEWQNIIPRPLQSFEATFSAEVFECLDPGLSRVWQLKHKAMESFANVSYIPDRQGNFPTSRRFGGYVILFGTHVICNLKICLASHYVNFKEKKHINKICKALAVIL